MLITWFFLCLGVWGASAGTHSFKAFYTVTTGITNYPDFTVMGVVDGMMINHYDSMSKQVVPRTEWMKNSEGPDYWKRQTDIIVGAEQSFKNNIQVAMGRFNQTGGVHTVQRMYGCEWDDQTGETDGFNQYGYDGEDFLSLDLKEMRYISPVQQGMPTAQNWSNDRANVEGRKHYLSTVCIEWLQKYVQYGKSSLQKTVSPQVSLLQKSSSSPLTCHATGFYPSGVTISWVKNGQEHHEDVDLGELLPNEDGTFQKTSTLRVTPDERKNNEYSCVVEHQGKSVTEDKIRTVGGETENPLYNKGEADRGGGNTDPSMLMASCTPELSDLLSKTMNQMTILCLLVRQTPYCSTQRSAISCLPVWRPAKTNWEVLFMLFIVHCHDLCFDLL